MDWPCICTCTLLHMICTLASTIKFVHQWPSIGNCCIISHEPLDPKPPYTHTDHKADLYNKPKAIITARTGVPCLTIQLVSLVFNMHSFTCLIIILLTDTHFRKREFSVVSKCISWELQNMHVWYIYKIDMQCRKSNNKHPCEFVLTRAVKLLHVIPLKLYNLEYWEKTYHQFYFYKSITL